jgi:hypothetical protein
MPGIDAFNDQRNLQLFAQLFAMGSELVGSRLQAMVNMNGFDLRGPLRSACQQQRGGVSTAAQCHGEWQSRFEMLEGQCRWQASG